MSSWVTCPTVSMQGPAAGRTLRSCADRYLAYRPHNGRRIAHGWKRRKEPGNRVASGCVSVSLAGADMAFPIGIRAMPRAFLPKAR